MHCLIWEEEKSSANYIGNTEIYEERSGSLGSTLTVGGLLCLSLYSWFYAKWTAQTGNELSAGPHRHKMAMNQGRLWPPWNPCSPVTDPKQTFVTLSSMLYPCVSNLCMISSGVRKQVWVWCPWKQIVKTLSRIPWRIPHFLLKLQSFCLTPCTILQRKCEDMQTHTKQKWYLCRYPPGFSAKLTFEEWAHKEKACHREPRRATLIVTKRSPRPLHQSGTHLFILLTTHSRSLLNLKRPKNVLPPKTSGQSADV